MIRAVAFCPHPPLLVPEVAQGAAGELADLRAACRTAIRRAAAAADEILVLGSGTRWQQHPSTARGSLAPYGVPVEIPLGSDEPGPVELPLSLTIGAWLLNDALGPNCGATGWSVGTTDDGEPARLEPSDDRPRALIVMGDGSARRSTTAPGYFDERAAAFDGWIVAALRSGEADRLHPSPSIEVGEQLLAAGTRVWDAAAGMLEGPLWDAELHYEAAPYGVGYFVAAWTRGV
ncbi:MAG: hypothetical protein QOJ34_311 [Pseudonocardiales bacterium]|nr:hypothetical protein [Pseudonocardiales bacterium]